MAKTATNRVYTECLRNHSEGHALWEDFSGKILKPGSFGFFNEDGVWKLLFQLDDTDTLNQHQLKPLGQNLDIKQTTGAAGWGPKHSRHVTGKKIDLKVDSPTGPPVTVGAAIEFESKSDRGAILVTKAPIVHHEVQQIQVQDFLNWMVANTAQLLKDDLTGDILKKRGVWIITDTYTTKHCRRHVFLTKDSKVQVGVNAGVTDVAQARVNVGWWDSANDSAWNWYKDNNGAVVMMKGIQFVPRIFGEDMKAITAKKAQKVFRSGTQDVVAQPILIATGEQSEGVIEMLELTPEIWPKSAEEDS